MKNLILTIVAVLAILTSCASPPTSGYKKFYREYRDAPETFTIKIPGGFANMLIDEDEEVEEFLSDLDDISLFVAENATEQMLIDLNNSLPKTDYKEMMVIRDGGDEVIFFAHELGNTIDEIIMTVVGEDELVVIAIFGEFTKEDAKRIARSINKDTAIKIRQ